jgi:hypothetical protein
MAGFPTTFSFNLVDEANAVETITLLCESANHIPASPPNEADILFGRNVAIAAIQQRVSQERERKREPPPPVVIQ